MTIPTRPAPPPPQNSGQRSESCRMAAPPTSASFMANTNLPQYQQQNNVVTVSKLTIKLPPPPVKSSTATIGTMSSSTNNKHPEGYNTNNNFARNFLKASYTPSISTNKWPDESPFDNIIYVNSSASNGRHDNFKNNTGDNNFVSKKVPPPRPPPPKLMSNGKKGNAPKPPLQPSQSLSLQHSKNILNQIFYRKKKDSKASIIPVTKSLSSSSQVSTITSTNSSTLINNNIGYGTKSLKNGQPTIFTTSDWNSAWNSNVAETTTTTPPTANEMQLISFDSPPSSPTFTQKSNSDCLSMDSFSSDSNFSSPNNGSVSQPESGFEDEFSAALARSRPATTSPPKDPWEAIDISQSSSTDAVNANGSGNHYCRLGTVPVRNLNNMRSQTNLKNGGGIDNPLCNGKSLLPPPPILQMPTIIKPRIAQKPKAPKPPITTTSTLQSIFQEKNSFNKVTRNGENNPITFGSAAPPLPELPDFLSPPSDTTARVDGDVFSASTTKNPVTLLDVISGKADALQLVGNGHEIKNDGNHSTEFINHENPFGIALYDFDSDEIGDLCFRVSFSPTLLLDKRTILLSIGIYFLFLCINSMYFFKENEKIYLLEKVNAEWYRGRNRSGCEGIFPANYITVKVPLTENHSNVNNSNNNSGNKNSTHISSKQLKVKCLYNFTAEVEGDLQLQVGVFSFR